MFCDVCQQPATEQCPLCATLLCADHGGPVCFRCAAASRATDEKPPVLRTSVWTTGYDSRRVWKKSYLQCETRSRPQPIHIEDEEPPSCYECGALTRQLCRNCRELYCPEHAGSSELCRRCDRSSLMGLAVLGSVGLFWAALLLLAF